LAQNAAEDFSRPRTHATAGGRFSMSVKIPEELFYDIVTLLTEPKVFNPAQKECVVSMDRRDQVLQRLLKIQRSRLFGGDGKKRRLWT
jgi:hypothetical protein